MRRSCSGMRHRCRADPSHRCRLRVRQDERWTVSPSGSQRAEPVFTNHSQQPARTSHLLQDDQIHVVGQPVGEILQDLGLPWRTWRSRSYTERGGGNRKIEFPTQTCSLDNATVTLNVELGGSRTSISS